MDMQQHLLSRWFDPQRYSGVWIEPGHSVTVAFWNTAGQMAGYQRYTPLLPKKGNKRYYTRFGKHMIGVWGLETVVWDSGPLFLTESLFNASRLHWHGLPAVAVISNDPAHLRSWLRTLPQWLIAACDGDQAGRKLARYAHQAIHLPSGEDVNSVSESVFQQLFGTWINQ
jgi:hypothetical protein